MDVYCTALIMAFILSQPHRHPWLFAAYIPSMGIKKATDICSGLVMFVTILNQFKQTKAIAVVSSVNGLSSVGQQFGIIEKSCIDNDLFKSASQ